jgi:hypothetical protein
MAWHRVDMADDSVMRPSIVKTIDDPDSAGGFVFCWVGCTDEEKLKRLHRGAQRQILDVNRQLADQKARGQRGGRKLSVDSVIKRDEIAQMVIYFTAMYPEDKRTAIIHDVAKFHGVNRSYVYGCLAETAPERRRHMELAAAAFVEWQRSRKS